MHDPLNVRFSESFDGKWILNFITRINHNFFELFVCIPPQNYNDKITKYMYSFRKILGPVIVHSLCYIDLDLWYLAFNPSFTLISL
jgi:hypothetical protein